MPKRNENRIVVLDTSALLAYFKNENGAKIVDEYLRLPGHSRYIHDINACETAYHLIRGGLPEFDTWVMIGCLDIIQSNFSSQTFKQRVASLKAAHRSFALGDCIALAFGEEMRADILTADKEFANIPAKSRVVLIR